MLCTMVFLDCRESVNVYETSLHSYAADRANDRITRKWSENGTVMHYRQRLGKCIEYGQLSWHCGAKTGAMVTSQ